MQRRASNIAVHLTMYLSCCPFALCFSHATHPVKQRSLGQGCRVWERKHKYIYVQINVYMHIHLSLVFLFCSSVRLVHPHPRAERERETGNWASASCFLNDTATNTTVHTRHAFIEGGESYQCVCVRRDTFSVFYWLRERPALLTGMFLRRSFSPALCIRCFGVPLLPGRRSRRKRMLVLAHAAHKTTRRLVNRIRTRTPTCTWWGGPAAKSQ